MWSMCIYGVCMCIYGVYMCNVCVESVCVLCVCVPCVWIVYVCTCMAEAVAMAPDLHISAHGGTCFVLCESGLGSPDTWREDVSSGKVRAEMDVGDEGQRRLWLWGLTSNIQGMKDMVWGPALWGTVMS